MCYEKSSKRFMVELYRQGNRDVKWTSRWRYAFERNTLKVCLNLGWVKIK
ncbi:hypothetical protein HanRHA438_Chr09g0393011 [Helianthus annuus]|nr:hypothetical protein HanRHA438_Chr09g0393011 [Helianthus annuus]